MRLYEQLRTWLPSMEDILSLAKGEARNASFGAIPWSEAQPRLVPLLRRCSALARRPDTSASAIMARPGLPFLVQAVGIRLEHGTQVLGIDAAERWAVCADDLFLAAECAAPNANLATAIAAFDPTLPYRIWHVAPNHPEASALLLRRDWLASFRGKVDGTPIAIVPEQGSIIVSGDGDARSVRKLIDIADRDYHASKDPLSMAVYTLGDQDRVVSLSLPAEHPLSNEIALGHVGLAVAEYTAQQEQLQHQLGDDVFVATFTAEQDQLGIPVSFASWTEDVPTLLPKADQIAFVVGPDRAESEVFRVPWVEVERVVGALLEPMSGIEPPRWRTTRWPDAALLDELRARSTS